jgi:hypothetical protein
LYRGGTATAITSSLKRPASMAAAARLWLSKASRSWSSRRMPFSRAIFSALSPMVRPVVGSLMAGGMGATSLSLSLRKAPSLAAMVLPRLASTSALARGRLAKSGASEMLSAPPAMATSVRPRARESWQATIDRRLVVQAWETVCATTFLGRLLRRVTSRPMRVSSGAGTTWPKTR